MLSQFAYPFLRPLLFSLDPEEAHHHTLALLELAHRYRLGGCLYPAVVDKPQKIMGLTFHNPVGLAAGLDKNGEHVDALAQLGFGFIEIGTVTPRPQPGNPKPRLFRLPQAQALINRLGFNNLGVTQLLRNLDQTQYKGILGINIGKNFDTPIERSAEDYLSCFNLVYPRASYITVNVSSPNTADLRSLQHSGPLRELLTQLKDAQRRQADKVGRYAPLLVKIAPDLTEAAIQELGGLLLELQMDGVIATNTTIKRDAVAHLAHGQETGGLSGGPVRAASTQVIKTLAQTLQGALPIIGVGGILSCADALAKKAAGANLIQLYTGLIYKGPHLIPAIAKAW